MLYYIWYPWEAAKGPGRVRGDSWVPHPQLLQAFAGLSNGLGLSASVSKRWKLKTYRRWGLRTNSSLPCHRENLETQGSSVCRNIHEKVQWKSLPMTGRWKMYLLQLSTNSRPKGVPTIPSSEACLPRLVCLNLHHCDLETHSCGVRQTKKWAWLLLPPECRTEIMMSHPRE